jgi:dihydrofolate reductase
LPGLETVVFSRTLSPGSAGGVTIVREDARKVVFEMKRMTGRDIWLFGGGGLAGQLLEAGLIDTIDIAIMPVVLGKGTQLFETALPAKILVADHVVLENSGVVVIRYAAGDRLNGTPLINYVRRGDVDPGLV